MINIGVKVAREKLLEKVTSNRTSHEQVVKEAREGYIYAAQQKLNEKMEELRKGTASSLVFAIRPPEDHLDEYDTVIEMLKWTEEAQIELTAIEFRQYVMDEWDWSRMFFLSNALYSPTASGCAEERGYCS